jgi:branched-chain amino acid transport system permease protein
MKPSRLIAVVILALLVASPYAGLIPGWTPGLATLVWFNALALMGLNLVFGVTGMLALGQAAFMAVPVYVAGMLDGLGLPFALCILVGLAGALLVAAIMARIFVRLPGIYLALGTLGFGYVVEGLARAFPNVTGGASGLVLARGRALTDFQWYVVAVASLAAGLAGYAWLVRGAFWRRLRTIHHDELAAATLGIDVSRTKERAFVIGSGFAIVAGLLRAYYVGVMTPEDGGINRSLEQLATVMIGGPGHLVGPLLGSAALQWLFVVTGYIQNYELLIYGAIFLLAVMYAREGLAGWIAVPWRKFQARVDRPELAIAPHAAEPVAAHPERTGVCLSVREVSKRFQGVDALREVSFTVAYGEIFTIVGPNGAGKSTLFNVISGIEAPTEGSVTLADRDITRLPISQRAAFIGRSFQVARLVPELSVLDNLLVRLDQISPGSTEEQRTATALDQIRAFGLTDIQHRRVAELSVGQHKLIDLTRAAVGDPQLVLLDEPAVGLAQEELLHLADLLMKLKARRCAVIIVEHNIAFVSEIAERGIVLDSGRPIAMGPIRQILADPKVNEAYFGALT